MAPISLGCHGGAGPSPLYNKNSLIRLFTFQRDDTAQDEVIHASHQRHAELESHVSMKCDVASGCGSQESSSHKARLRAAESQTKNRLDKKRRIHASKSSEQMQARYYDTDVEDEEDDENEKEIKIENEHENEIVYRVCQYSTGSRYGYLIDHCPESMQSVPPRPHSISHTRQVHDYPTKPPGVRVDLTPATIALALVFLLLVAIILVEIVDVICEARRSSSPKGECRGRTRTRRALTRAFGAPRKLFVDDPEKETIRL